MLSPLHCAVAVVLCAAGTGCALPATVPVAGAALGAADVCVPQRYILPGAPTGLGQITSAFTRQ